MDTANKEPIKNFYDLGKEIGKGAFATVHLCTNKKDGKQYAVKMIQKKPSSMESLETEIRIMSMIQHPHVVRLVDLFDTPTHIYMVLELLTGGELFDRIIEIQNYAEKDAAQICTEILSAVHHLHDKDIVHRDLKPENLLLAGKDSTDVKLADFGLSKWLVETPVLMNCAGTPGYLAPEILEAYYHKVPYGKTVDMWSTGVILYILLFGFPPFWEEDQDEMFEKIRKGDYEFPDNMTISPAAKDLITRLLTVDPKKRITAKEALEHPWIKGEASAAPLAGEFKAKLKQWNARRRFKGAINAVRALNKMKTVMGASPVRARGSGDVVAGTAATPAPAAADPPVRKIEVQQSANDVLPMLPATETFQSTN